MMKIICRQLRPNSVINTNCAATRAASVLNSELFHAMTMLGFVLCIYILRCGNVLT